MTADDERRRRRRAAHARGECQHVIGFESVHPGNADQARFEVVEVVLDGAAEPEVRDASLVATRFERRRDVFHPERLDSKERAQPEPLARRNWTK